MKLKKKVISQLSEVLKDKHLDKVPVYAQINLAKAGVTCSNLNTEYESVKKTIVDGNKPKDFDSNLEKLKAIESKGGFDLTTKDGYGKWKESLSEQEFKDHEDLAKKFNKQYVDYQKSISEQLKKIEEEESDVEINKIEKSDFELFIKANNFTTDEVAILFNIMK